MPLITIPDIYNRIYQEVVDEITRDSDATTQAAIDAAVGEAKMYLSKYDVSALFGDALTDPVNPDQFLKNICVDIAVYRLVLLANPNIKYEVALASYELAIKSLRAIQKGEAVPAGWPVADTTGSVPASIYASYQTKRENNW